MSLDLRDLAVFLAVERHGSFGRAATELLVSQPAVSERIRNLERAVGRPVFERSTRGASLTPTGEALLPYARRCVALADEAVEQARRAEGVPRFVIAVHSTFAPRIVPFVLGALASLPRRVAVRDAHSDEIPTLVADGAADVGFAIPGPATRGVRRVGLRRDPVVCVAAPDHAIAGVRKPTAASLADTVVALNAWGDGADEFLARARDAGVDDWRTRFCADAATALALASDHGHVAFVAKSAVRTDDNRVREIPLAGIAQWSIHLDLLHRSRDEDDPAIRSLVAAIDAA